MPALPIVPVPIPIPGPYLATLSMISCMDPLLYNLNNLVLVDLDKFYVTVDHYFVGKGGRIAEELLRLPLGKILFIDGSVGQELYIKVAMDGLKYPN